MLESSIADYGDEPVTVDGIENNTNNTVTSDVDNENISNIEEFTGISNNEADNSEENNTDENNTDIELPKENITDEEVYTGGFDENREYSSSLHKMRDTILNKNTKSEITADTDLTKLFTVENKDDVMRDEAMSAVLPGAFMLGLFDCTGAELGNNITSSVCIKDNDQRTEQTELYFEEDSISAYDQNSTVRLKLMRSNNIETYQLLEVQTMAGSAKADTNYSSLVTEAVLLAGQEYKYIDIPIKRADISEPVDFEVRVSGAKCNDTQANITIYPTDASDGIALMNDDISMYAASEQPTEVLQGKSYNNSSYADSGKLHKWNNSEGWGVLELSSDNHRWGYLYYDLDLRGIEKVTVTAHGEKASTKYPSRVQHRIYIEGGNKEFYKEKNWNAEEFTFNSNNFAHKKSKLVAKAESWHHNDTKLFIHNIKLYKQQIVLSFEQPDTFKIPIYSDMKNITGYYTENGSEKVVAPQSSISAVNKSSSRPSKYYRDDTLTLTSSLSADGKKIQCISEGL